MIMLTQMERAIIIHKLFYRNLKRDHTSSDSFLGARLFSDRSASRENDFAVPVNGLILKEIQQKTDNL